MHNIFPIFCLLLGLSSFAVDMTAGYACLGLKSEFFHQDELVEPYPEVLSNMLELEEDNKFPQVMKTISILGFRCINGDELLYYIWDEKSVDNIFKLGIRSCGDIKYYLMESRFLNYTFPLDTEAIKKSIDIDIILQLINEQLESIDWEIYRGYQGEKSVLIARNFLSGEKHTIFNIADFYNAADIVYKISTLVKKEKNFDIKLRLAYLGEHIDLESLPTNNIQILFNSYVDEILGNDTRY